MEKTMDERCTPETTTHALPATIPGLTPPSTHANRGTPHAKPFQYRCQICGGWHVYPQPCHIRHEED